MLLKWSVRPQMRAFYLVWEPKSTRMTEGQQVSFSQQVNFARLLFGYNGSTEHLSRQIVFII